jgi:hypothetical protein
MAAYHCIIGLSLSAYGEMLAKREMHRILNTPRSNTSPMYYGTPSELISLLRTTITVMRVLETHPLLARSAHPRLWHTDLHMGNIFVAEQDPSRIVSLIDWQSIQVAPMFLQARWPVFLTPPKTHKPGFTEPQLPADFDKLDSDEQDLARDEWQRATNAKLYEAGSYLNDHAAYEAMNVPSVFWKLFVRCGEIWEVGCVPLRECLIEIFLSWAELGLPGTPPFSFREDEIRTHISQFKEYEECGIVRDFAKEYLDTYGDGWIPPEADFAEYCVQNKKLLNLFLDQMAGEMAPEEARKMWPFLEDA